MPYKRKSTRLPANCYLGGRSYFITLCCDHRRPHFAEPAAAQCVLSTLLECSADHPFQLHAFCIMADHLHLLAQGTDSRADLLEFIRLFKQRTAYAFRKTYAARLWQMGFYDYILRPSDSIEDVACYIWWNPVRKGLCANPEDYVFSGSQTIEWMQRGRKLSSWLPPWKLQESHGEPV